jgi:hypothetical protein
MDGDIGIEGPEGDVAKGCSNPLLRRWRQRSVRAGWLLTRQTRLAKTSLNRRRMGSGTTISHVTKTATIVASQLLSAYGRPVPLLVASMAPSFQPLERRWTSLEGQRCDIRAARTMTRLNKRPWRPGVARPQQKEV